MTDLTPSASFDDVVQLETTDRALGGTGNPMNRQAQALLNRTQFLRNAQIVLQQFDTDLGTDGDPAKGVGKVAGAQRTVMTIAALAALGAGVTSVNVLHRTSIADAAGGVFDWVAGDQSANVAADPLQGVWVAPGSDITGASGAYRRILENGVIRADFFGADGSNDSAAVQAALQFSSDNALVFEWGVNNVSLESQVSITGFPSVRGGGKTTVVTSTFTGASIVATVTSQTERREWRDFTCSNTAVDNTGSPLLLIDGDDSLFQYNTFSDIACSGHEYLVEVNKDTFTTGFGEESPFSWNRFINCEIRPGVNNAKALIHLRDGSGTGNGYWNIKGRPEVAFIHVESLTAPGAVCGDIIFGGSNTGGIAAAAILKIGADTVYRSRVLLTGNQFDAGLTTPLILDTAGIAYTGITSVANNNGGLVDWYSQVPALSMSQIHDQGISEWKMGVQKTGIASGPQSVPVATIALGVNTGTYLTMTVNGTVQGVGSGITVKRVSFRRAATGNTPVVIETSQNPASASFFDITFTNNADGTTNIFVTLDGASPGSNLDFQLSAMGGTIKVRNGS